MESTIEFTLPARIRKKGRWFISSCPPLDVHSQGGTRDEAQHNLIDALTTFFVSCYERGTLEDVLRESGFVPSKAKSRRRTRGSSNEDSVVVPVPFAISRRTGREAAS